MFSFLKKIPSISITEFEAKIFSKPVILDVRTPTEYRAFHVKGSKNVPLDRVYQYSGDKTKPIYVICQSGLRSKKATKFLRRSGYEAFHVEGGMNQWNKQR